MIFKYISTVAFTMPGANFSFPFVAYGSESLPFKISVNIFSIDFYDRSGAHSILKCLNNLGVT